ncbi:MAG: permease-like cell division protein FtsX [Candidatus Saganbacteria bacterium]|nr:permease-like cell division protein FtsX [Candidatus Saganbacteria bacterium]
MSFEFFLREAWNGFRRSGIMSVISLATITVSLVVLGAFLLVMFNLGHIIDSVGSKMEIVAYVDKPIDDYTASTYMLQLTKIEGVQSVRYISKDEAWSDFKRDFEGRLELEEIVKDNPLPNAFVIKVKKPQLVTAVAKKISNVPDIDEVRYSGRLADRFQTLLDAVRLGGLILVALLILATLLIVVNTIRLTVIARQTDIAIMKLVGATNNFIKWPFIIEGILIGVIGAALSFIILKFSYDLVAMQIMKALPFIPLVTSKTELFLIYGAVSVTGVLLGALGGYISVNSLLKETM